VSEQLFLFVQLEFPWELGPPDGRYLVRERAGEDPSRVIVLDTLGAGLRAERRGARLRPAARAGRGPSVDPEPEPTAVPTSRATLIDPTPVAVERQAQAWLREIDVDHVVAREVAVLNRVLHMQRLAYADPYVREVTSAQALAIRAGWGVGEQVAYGKWLHALELRGGGPPRGAHARRRRGRVAALRAQERFAELLGARSNALVCEELTLRARLDVDAGRIEHAAIELASAYSAALTELREEAQPELEIRLAELAALADKLTPSERDEDVLRHALERLEAALRARSAAGGRS
jgi:hypothetical protein